MVSKDKSIVDLKSMRREMEKQKVIEWSSKHGFEILDLEEAQKHYQSQKIQEIMVILLFVVVVIAALYNVTNSLNATTRCIEALGPYFRSPGALCIAIIG